MGDEVDSDGEQGTESSENGDIVAINLAVDRTAAIKGQVRPDKFLIVIHQLDQKPDKQNEFQAYDRGRSFDWNLSEHIRALNRWRSQILRRNLGSARAARFPFHDDEIEWLYQVHRAFRQAARDRGVAVNWHRMRWNDITTEFNNHFENWILAGDPTPRPARTKASLTTERYRVKRICDLAGLTPKAPTSKNPTKPAPENKSGEDTFGKDDEGGEGDEDATEDEAVEH
ncbi:hypothetical protein OEA41_000531 [Lepraria neglecta]|uniref:Uncharacterized protein n=1 Tax=Lepraria neglecta TaxID=209136 RepID=A0AAD9ZFW8_9LECA|nr:hypothetical protein OEA41_000531 [Lepraria neglecta]